MNKYAILLAISLLSCNTQKSKIKVACVGDSITEGYGMKIESETSYPVVLDRLLSDQYTVLNAGRSSTTVQKTGNRPYWNDKEFSNVFAFEPDIIVLKLGTNDTKPINWNADQFKQDYQMLIDTLQTISTQPTIYLCSPVPVFKTNWGINDSTMINGIIPIVEELANINNLTLIDLYQELNNQNINFTDGIHPNEEAAKIMAEVVANSILKND